jgi:hypothetical protein
VRFTFLNALAYASGASLFASPSSLFEPAVEALPNSLIASRISDPSEAWRREAITVPSQRKRLRPVQFENPVCQFVERHIDGRVLIIRHAFDTAVDERL